jgi:hypothetical protein
MLWKWILILTITINFFISRPSYLFFDFLIKSINLDLYLYALAHSFSPKVNKIKSIYKFVGRRRRKRKSKKQH